MLTKVWIAVTPENPANKGHLASKECNGVLERMRWYLVEATVVGWDWPGCWFIRTTAGWQGNLPAGCVKNEDMTEPPHR